MVKDKLCKGFYKLFSTYGNLIFWTAFWVLFAVVFINITNEVSSAFDISFFSAFIRICIIIAVIAAIPIVLWLIWLLLGIYEKGEKLVQAKQQKEGEHEVKNAVTEFIKRRFPDDCSWTTGNCYFFAVILKARFPKGEIYYDVIDGHFVFKLNGTFYDHSGLVFVNTSNIVLWDNFKEYDEGRYKAIVRGCIR